MGAYFQGAGNPGPAIGNLYAIVKELGMKQSEPDTKYAALGFCWGAKVSNTPLTCCM